MRSDRIFNHFLTLRIRISSRVKCEIHRIVTIFYIYIVVAPILLSKGKISFPFSVKLGYGVALIFSNNRVLKVAISKKSTIEKEYHLWLSILGKFSSLSYIFPKYIFRKYNFLSILESEKLIQISPNECLSSAVRIRFLLNNYSNQNNRLDINMYPQVQAGLTCIRENFGVSKSSQLYNIIERYLSTNNYHTGLCHGDFHSRNIMRDQNGIEYLIDLDCVRFDGIVELDALYFALELKWTEYGDHWLQTLSCAFHENGNNISGSLLAFSIEWCSDLGVLFFIDRLGQELINFGHRYSEIQMYTVINAIHDCCSYSQSVVSQRFHIRAS